MSKSGNKRSRAVSIRAYELSQMGYTHRQIADLCLLKPEQVPGRINAGKLASIRDERPAVNGEGGQP